MLLLLSFTAGICWYFKVTDGCVCPNSPQDFLWLVGQCCTSFAAGNRHKSFCKSFLQFSTRIFCFVKSNQFLFLFEEKLPDFHPSPHPHKRRNPEQWKQQPEWVQCFLCFLFCVVSCTSCQDSPNNAALLFAIDATRPGVNAWQQPQNKYWWTNVKAQFGRIFGIKYRIGAHELWHCPENQSRVRSSAVSMGGDTTQRCWRKLLVPEALQPWSLANHSDTLAVFQKPLSHICPDTNWVSWENVKNCTRTPFMWSRYNVMVYILWCCNQAISC